MTPYFLSAKTQEQLFEELESWRGTKFAENQCVKGAGVDCVRFAAAVLVRLGAINRFDWPRYALRGAGKLGEETILRTIRQNIPNLIECDDPVMPGDVVLLRNSGVTHVGLLGRHPEVWHALVRKGVTDANLKDPVIARSIAWRFRAYHL